MSCPVRFEEASGMWVVRDPRLVRSVLADPESFSPTNALTAFHPLGGRALRILASAGFAVPPTLANNATASHRTIRRAVARFFTPARVRAVEPLTRRLIRSRVADVRSALDDGRQVDLVEKLARDLPALVLLDLLRLDDLDIRALKRWSADSLELFWGTPQPAAQERLATSAAEFYTMLRKRTVAARRSPSDDLIGCLAALGLAEREICGAAYFVLVAGHETTSYLIATALYRLLGEPVRWRLVGRSHEHARRAVEEVLAEESSVPTWRRMSTRDTVLGGVRIAAEDPLLLRLSGIGGSGDLAFGVGPHRCLGAALARMEARVALQETALELPEARLVEVDPPMLDLLSFRAPRRVRVGAAVPEIRPSTGLVRRPGAPRLPGPAGGPG